ncbi:hypothetical protein [Photobacterium leiognathi]|uniref:hypothetical protein n=1 Tax=Photobacterium leiognathi TaxID=553611 RepID=UPI002980DA10|nr:hypothetical protein [Photobacterium leiognathi]
MILPTLIKAPLSDNKTKLLRQHNAPFRYYTATTSHHYLYISQTRSFARAEAWLARYRDVEGGWGVIEHINDDQFFIMFVSNNELLVTDEGDIDTLMRDYDVLLQRYHAQLFWCAPQHALMQGEIVEPLSEVELTPFALTPSLRRTPLIVGGAIVLSALLGFAGWLMLSQPAPPSNVTPVDPYLAYRTAVSHTSSAHDGLKQAVTLSAIAATVPQGWQVVSITLDNATATLTVNRLSEGQRPVITTWLAQHPELSGYRHLSLNTLTITLPVRETLTAWQDHLMPSTIPLTSLTDTFIALGWTVTPPVKDGGLLTTMSTFSIKKQTDLAALLSLDGILKQLPVSAKATLTPAGHLWDVAITFTFYGAST